LRASAEIDRRFLRFVTDLLLCSECLRRGVRTKVPQVISRHHRPRNRCRDCSRGSRHWRTVHARRGL